MFNVVNDEHYCLTKQILSHYVSRAVVIQDS